jgi:hypothetical protein
MFVAAHGMHCSNSGTASSVHVRLQTLQQPEQQLRPVVSSTPMRTVHVMCGLFLLHCYAAAPLPPPPAAAALSQIEFGGTCHISGRPYTVFRWRPGNDARYKKTIICQEVAKAKNVCQVRALTHCPCSRMV